ncbi:hypothetical protein B0T18DRAFT_409552 [Schizothecium vesticola]|uniref:Uncharacterized protein n=1 Tax=Schizothecium vesticola TaxID=314040 RepID=A0AA40K4D4_9PEZI|nr:hypothetical protein B0T18DRAFT_409552 [Schizothecium vesticola]
MEGCKQPTSSSRGMPELTDLPLPSPPPASPSPTAGQSGVRNEGVEGRTVETPRYSPGRLVGVRKSAINQITPPEKGETWAGSPVSRPSPVIVADRQLAIVSLRPPRSAKRRLSSPTVRAGLSDGDQPVHLLHPRTRHHVAHSTDRDDGSMYLCRDRRIVVVHHHQPPHGPGRITGTSHMPSLELCTCFLLAFCCIVLALQLLQSTSGPRCTLQAMQTANPRTIDTWGRGASFRNRENLAASLVVRDQWEP